MPLPGYRGSLYFTGTSTSMTGEATTNTTGNEYQITDAAKQIINPAESVTVLDGGVPVASSDYTVDYLTGTVILASAPGGAVTITAEYLPRLEVGCAKSTSWNFTRDMLDTTCLSETDDFRKRKSGLLDLNVSLSHIMPFAAYGAVVDGNTFVETLAVDDSVQVLEYRIPDALQLRALVNAESVTTDSSFDSLVEEGAEFVLAGEGTAYFSIVYL